MLYNQPGITINQPNPTQQLHQWNNWSLRRNCISKHKIYITIKQNYLPKQVGFQKLYSGETVVYLHKGEGN
jgi:hypothetical protein